MDTAFGSSLNLTFYDLISHLIPGTALLLSLYFMGDLEWFSASTPTEILIASLLVFGYLLGHLLFIVGNILYNTYIHPSKFKKDSILYKLVFCLHTIVKFIVREDYKNNKVDLKKDICEYFSKKFEFDSLDQDNQKLYQLCDAWVSKDLPDREVLLAKQGFYRAISALVVIIIPYIIWRGGLGFPILLWLIFGTIILRLLLNIHTSYGKLRRNQLYLLTYLKIKENKK